MLKSLLDSISWSYSIIWTPCAGGLSWENGEFSDSLSQSFSLAFHPYLESCRITPQQHGLASKAVTQRANLWHHPQHAPLMSDQMEEMQFFKDAGIQTVVCVLWGSNVLELGSIEFVPQEQTTSDNILEASQKTLLAVFRHGTQSRMTESQKRHMLTERKRRSLEKEHLATLKRLIPFPTKRDKVSILEGVIKHLQDQQRSDKEHHEPRTLKQTRVEPSLKTSRSRSKSDDSGSGGQQNGLPIIQKTIFADDILPALSNLEGSGYVVRSVRVCPSDASMLELEAHLEPHRTFQVFQETSTSSSVDIY